MRYLVQKKIKNVLETKRRLFNWARKGDTVLWLDSNSHNQKYSNFEAFLAVGAHSYIKTDYYNAFSRLQTYKSRLKDWVCGYFTYDLKNDIENLSSANPDSLNFPDLFFFQPTKIIRLRGNYLEFLYLQEYKEEVENDFLQICNQPPPKISPIAAKGVKIKLRMPREAYLQKADALLQHIQRGDVYEANLCQEFYAEKTRINPWNTFVRLNSISKAPFTAFFKWGAYYALCASPERYLQRTGGRIISQPIKGTARRAEEEDVDFYYKKQLEKDPKERSENIMIVDLVRNDLSLTAKKGSVKVTELCKVYTFDQVHQLISTVQSEVKASKSSLEVIRKSFPMGSMTGAPKISAMEIIEKLETSQRGLYSGSLGYFSPQGDFDFNVVIRTILYNKNKSYVSLSVGSALTRASIPTKEYQECLLKAKALREVLE